MAITMGVRERYSRSRDPATRGGLRDAGLDGSQRPRAQLAILPGLTHYEIASAPALVAAVSPFLADA